mgnify:CR=1 FL=1
MYPGRGTPVTDLPWTQQPLQAANSRDEKSDGDDTAGRRSRTAAEP